MNNLTQQTLFQSDFEDSKLAQLKQLYPNCFNKSGEFLIDKFNETIQSLNILISQESYSLQWLGKSYAKALQKLPPETLLAEDIIHNNKPENKNSQNLLIKGDNLEVLKHLKNAYAEKVKMIYIDPPYNTGSDGFVYQDDRKFTAEQLAELGNMDLEAAQRVIAFTTKKSNSHSAWLTFMYPRLYIARELLREDGVIFISIDDNEQAQLKILCDEVFGEGHCIIELIRKTKSTTNDAKIGINNQHEYCLVYAKNITNIKLLGGEKNLEKYSNPDNDPNGDWAPSDPSAKSGRAENNYFAVTNPYTGKQDFPPMGRFWFFSKNTLQKHINDGTICFKQEHKENERSFIFKRYKKDLKTTQKTLDSLAACENTFMNQTATKELLEIGMGEYFSYPKGVQFIQHLITHGADENAIIFDFFSGSGTTAHAVMKLNAKDGGDRRFILVQLPEKNDKKSEAYKEGFETIFDITKARIEKSAGKIREEFSDFNGNLGFKIFETVPDFRTPILENSQTEMYPVPHFSDEQIQTLLTTWRLYDGQPLTENIRQIELDNYTAYLGKDTLYLLYPEFNSNHIKALIEMLDNTEEYANFSPTRIVLHGDLIESSKQKELAQAVQTYVNKKSISISLIARV